MRDNRLKVGAKRMYCYKTDNFAAGVNAAADEEIMDLYSAKYTCNFDFSGGALKTGYGLVAARENIKNASNIWVYKSYSEKDGYTDTLMFSTDDGYVYYIKNGVAVKAENILLEGIPLAINYKLYGKDVILICSDKDRMYVWDGIEAYQVTDSPFITSMAMHYERLFVSVGGAKNAVWFSDDLDPTNWNTDLDYGGFIELADERGRTNKVISMMNYVYIFRDYGISRLTAFAEQSDFSVSNLFVSSGRIYPDTIALCGDTVLFLADDGLYRFDGLSTSKIYPKLSGIIESAHAAHAAYHDGKYYLSVRVKREGGGIGVENDGSYVNNALIIIDVSAKKYNICRGFDIKRIASVKADGASRVYAIERDGRVGEIAQCGEYFGEPLKKVWRSAITDLGINDKTKNIRKIIVDTKYDITLKIITESGEKSFNVKGGAGLSTVNVNIKADKAGFEIISQTKEALISKPTLFLTTS